MGAEQSSKWEELSRPHERPRVERPPASSWPPKQHGKPLRALAESRNRIAIARERSHCVKSATSKSRRSSSSTRRVLHASYVSVRQRRESITCRYSYFTLMHKNAQIIESDILVLIVKKFYKLLLFFLILSMLYNEN